MEQRVTSIDADELLTLVRHAEEARTPLHDVIRTFLEEFKHDGVSGLEAAQIARREHHV